jgi:endonuclease/exonuclease/phosphatase family metal-dependent hydrolase
MIDFNPQSLNLKSLNLLGLALVLAACARAPALHELPSPAPEPCRAPAAGNSGTPRIRWYGPDRVKDHRQLWWRCLGVGPVVVWTAGSRATQPVDSLVVVSWNVHVGGAHLDELIGDLKAGRLTGGQPVTHFVLLLQEAFRGGLDTPPTGFIGARALIVQPAKPPRVSITETARSHDLHLYYVPSTRNGNDPENREDRGNAILSTIPLNQFSAYELPFEIHRRVALTAGIGGQTTAGVPWQLTLGIVHLDATLVRVAMWRDLGMGRKRQSVALATMLGQHPAIVVGGDFNTLFKGEAALRTFERSIGRIRGSDSRPTRPPFQPDHIFARLPGGWRIEPYRRLDSTYHSDHYPLITRVVFTRASTR